MVSILIADDHAVVRSGLKQILSDSLQEVTFGEAGTGQEAIREARKGGWSVVLLDINMPGKNGLEILRQLKDEYPHLPVLILSMHPEDQFAVRMLRAGASGYLTKETAPDELVKAVNKVLRGGRYVSATLAEKLAEDLQTGAQGPLHQSLSDREYQVLCLIASGKTVGEISDLLSLSVKTISTYRARVLQKMNMKTNAELTHYAIQNQLVAP